MDITIGSVVKSKAGRDKDSFYVVQSLEGGRAFLIDGKYRHPENPKQKNIKHLAPTKTAVSLPQTDKQLRKLLNTFTQED